MPDMCRHNAGVRFVRLASASDASAIAAVHAAAWITDYATVLPADMLTQIDAHAIAEQWAALIEGPGTVHVATDGDAICGVLGSLVHGGGAELLTLAVDPKHRGRGHGSRLMSAFADTARASGAADAFTWCPEPNTALAAFLESAGWGPDGGRRSLVHDDTQVAEVRFVTSLTSASPPRSPQA
jgi:ribosomal protein S18 acetylase RimI-like enzyme